MKLLLTGCFAYTEEQKKLLRELGYEVYYMQQEKEELVVPASEIDATVCNGLFLKHNIDLFTNLKFIQLTSAGFDRVPINEIKERGIELWNARGIYSIPIAEWVIFRVLEHYKRSCFFKQEQALRKWTKQRELREVVNTYVAIVGAGSVGQEVSKRFQAFGAHTIGFDIHTNEVPYFNEMALTSSLLERVNMFDVVVLTAPLLPSTYRLISREVLMNMKKNAILVNVARGGLVDEQALCEVLSKRNDLFAALDVFESEPLSEDSQLWGLENVAVSPHNAFVSNSNNYRMFNVIYRNLKNFINR